MNKPRDVALYQSTKTKIYAKYPIHSAYRSGHLVKSYKKAFREKHGTSQSPYIGKRQKDQGLSRWFAEDWRNERGQVGYSKPGDIYRPTKRISQKTPTTMKELSPKQIQRAKKQKKETGHVQKFKTTQKK